MKKHLRRHRITVEKALSKNQVAVDQQLKQLYRHAKAIAIPTSLLPENVLYIAHTYGKGKINCLREEDWRLVLVYGLFAYYALCE